MARQVSPDQAASSPASLAAGGAGNAAERQCWILDRNCSLTPRQTLIAHGAVCAGCGGVALLFAVAGYPIISCFALLEAAALCFAVVAYARRARDRETMTLHDGCLVLERHEAGRIWRHEMPARSARISWAAGQRSNLVISSAGVEVEIGRFCTERQCVRTADELRTALLRPSSKSV